MRKNKHLSKLFLSIFTAAAVLGTGHMASASAEIIQLEEESTADAMSAEELAHREVLEEITLKESSSEKESLLNISVRNTTGDFLPEISIYYAALDENGEVLTAHSLMAERIEKDESKLTGNFSVHCSLEDISYIEINAFGYGEPSGTEGGGYVIKNRDVFTKTLIYRLDEAECVTEDGVLKYIWKY
ncbi:MAG: hypothetical protein Q4B26_05890 [Eubacteriales bacterium]|nr:hypothetical protein [Eubacteriales bacterium]